ncbi:hypothetical protein GQR36_11295 [Enterococcus termitis]
MIEQNESMIILTNQKYIFLHSAGNKQTFCLDCYKERLKELDQYHEYFGWVTDQPNPVEIEMIDVLKEN